MWISLDPKHHDLDIAENAWDLFTEFFREVKCHADWTDEEIDLSKHNGDIAEFVEWLAHTETDKPRRIIISIEE